jgi:hypothetical protein
MEKQAIEENNKILSGFKMKNILKKRKNPTKHSIKPFDEEIQKLFFEFLVKKNIFISRT